MRTPSLFTLALAFTPSILGCGAAQSGASNVDASGREPVRFERQLTTGRHWIDVAHHSEQNAQVTSAEGHVVENQSETTSIDLEARITVLAVGTDGDASRLRVEVRRFLATRSSGAASPTLPAVLIVERGQPGTIHGEAGETLDEETIDLLSHVLPMTHEEGGPGDRMFGSETPRGPGESWAIDTAPIAEAMSSESLDLSSANLTGSTTFVERTTQQGSDCLVLQARIAAEHFAIPSMPEGSEVQRSSFTFTAEGTMPRDPSLPMLRETLGTVIALQVGVVVPDAPPMVVNVDMVEQTTHTRTLD